MSFSLLLRGIIDNWRGVYVDIRELEDALLARLGSSDLYDSEGGYPRFAREIANVASDGVLAPVKSSPTNGRQPALKQRYRRVQYHEGEKAEMQAVLRTLHPAIDVSFYLSAPLDVFAKDKDALLSLDRFLRRDDCSSRLAVACGPNERSLEIFDDEKFLRDRGLRFLSRCRFSWKRLNLFELTEPFMAEKYRVQEISHILVIENQETYHSVRRALSSGAVPGIGRVDLLVYGEGKKAVGSLDQLRMVYGISPCGLTIHYFGDIDPEGVDIFGQIQDRYSMWSVHPAEQLYKALLQTGRVRPLGRSWYERFAPHRDRFSSSLGDHLAAVASSGGWYPQEGLSYAFFAGGGRDETRVGTAI